jgi:hypothetical protein
VRLGNITPDPIKSVEKRLWRVIIDIATTSSSLKDVVKEGLRDIQHIIAQCPNASQLEPYWFRAGQFEFNLTVYFTGSDWFINADLNESKAATCFKLVLRQEEEEEESGEEGTTLIEVDQSEGGYEGDLDSFAMSASGSAPLEDHSVVSKTPLPEPSIQLPRSYNSPPPAYAKECSVPSTIRDLLRDAGPAPLSVGQFSITGLPENDTGMDKENDVDMEASPGNEHDDRQAAGEGEQSDSMDVDVGVTAEDEPDDNRQDEGTESSSSSRKKSPSPAEHETVHSGEKRKNPTRAAKSKAKPAPSPPPARRKPKPKPKPAPASKPKSRAQSNDHVRSYFEEIEFGGISGIVEMMDLTQDIVSHSSV